MEDFIPSSNSILINQTKPKQTFNSYKMFWNKEEFRKQNQTKLLSNSFIKNLSVINDFIEFM